MMQGHLSAVIQLGDYATAAQRFLVGVETVRDWTELDPLNDERRWERSQEGDALVSVAVAAAAALNDVAAVTQTASRTPQPTPAVAFAFISIAAVHLPLWCGCYSNTIH